MCEINEQHYLKKISTLLGEKTLQIRKVPGACGLDHSDSIPIFYISFCIVLVGIGVWKDEPLDDSEDPELQKQKKLREQGVLTILKRKDLVSKVHENEVLQVSCSSHLAVLRF